MCKEHSNLPTVDGFATGDIVYKPGHILCKIPSSDIVAVQRENSVSSAGNI